MKPWRVWWIPLLLVLMPPVLGSAPAARDLWTYFAPMRAHTAAASLDGQPPWLNRLNGCGEAWFANPQTGVLYPPRWLHLLLPTPHALTAEIALHLAWLALGVGRLARAEGERGWGRTVVEASAFVIGPVLAVVGLISVLESASWTPWMVLAARSRAPLMVPALATATGLAWLAGDPQVWAVAVLVTLVLSRGRGRAAAGLALGVGMAAIQMIPFAAWVAEGDRGPATAPLAAAGALPPAAWLDLIVPGVARQVTTFSYLDSLFVGAPLLLLVILGARGRRAYLLLPLALAALAVLPAVGGTTMYLALTRGLVRYPARFALLAVLAAVPLAARGHRRWLDGEGRRIAIGVAATAALAAVTTPLPSDRALAIAAALPLASAAVAPLGWRRARGAAVAAGLGVALAASVPLLGCRALDRLQPSPRGWSFADASGRIYQPHPARFPRDEAEASAWGMGYTNLWYGEPQVRTYAPVANAAVTEQIEHVERGGVWWLDTAAARAVVLPQPVDSPRLERVGSSFGSTVYRNRFALSVASLRSVVPEPGSYGVEVGRVRYEARANRVAADVDSAVGGVLWLSLAPLDGWSWELDGRPVDLEGGPGVVQWLAIDPGIHLLQGRYRPPFLLPSAAVSFIAAIVALALAARGLVQRGGSRSRTVTG